MFAPLVSIVVPTYERSSAIEACLQSLITQDYPAVEVVVVDDGSTDGTEAKVTRICEDFPDANIKYVYKENGGAQSARNRGILESRGDFIQFLDSDDLLYPTNISEKVKALEGNCADMVVANVEILDLVDDEISIIDNDTDLGWCLAAGGSIHTSAPLIARRVFDSGLIWNPGIKREQDKVFAFRAVLLADKIIKINKVLSTYVIHNEPQISDGYHLRPQFGAFLLEDYNLFLSRSLSRPIQARAMIARHAAHILRRAFWYYTKKVLASLLGKQVYDRLRKINK